MSDRGRHAHVFIMLWTAALASFVLMLCATGSSDGVAAMRGYNCGRIWQSPRKATDHQLRTSTLCLVNRARERRGIPRLRFNAHLRRSATALSRSMVRGDFFSHYGPRGSTPVRRISHAGYLARASSYRVAENIAAGRGRSSGSPAAIVRQWMRSPVHRANILDRSLRDFGVGIARGNPFGGGRNAATYTLDFGARRHR